MGARLRRIGPYEVQYAGLLKQAHRVGSLDVRYDRQICVAIGPAELSYGRLHSRVLKLGDWDLEYDWLGTRLRRIGGRRGVLVGLLLVVVLGVVGVMALGGRPSTGSSTSESAPPPSALNGGGVAARDAAAAPAPAQADPGSVPIGGVTRSLVRTAQLSVDADDPVAATRRVRAAVAGAAGTVSQESSTDSGA